MSGTCLVVVDLQNDFMPGGALAVPRGDEVVPLINRLAARFDNIETLQLAYGMQVLWPDHCVQGTSGSAFHSDLNLTKAQLVIRKGHHAGIDSYSAFLEADRGTATGLAGYLRERQLEKLYVCGLATDFCVAWTALDARAAGLTPP